MINASESDRPTNPTSPELLPARIPGDPKPTGPERLLIVEDPEIGSVAVRWTLGRIPAWRCRACGPMSAADCLHVFSAAIRLAQDLLGLEPTIPVPTERTTTK